MYNIIRKIEARLPSSFHGFRSIFAKHLEVIKEFGHFPHRNHILKRKSTSEEVDFMHNPACRFDLMARIDPVTGKIMFGRDPNALWRLFYCEMKAWRRLGYLISADNIIMSAYPVSQEKEEEYRTLFGQLDIDGSGDLDVEELTIMFEASNKYYSNEKLQSLVTHLGKVNQSGSSGIGFKKFIEIMEMDLGEDSPPPSISEFFSIFDQDHDGQVTLDEFYVCINMINPTITHLEIMSMFQYADLDKNGLISFDEFYRKVIELHHQ